MALARAVAKVVVRVEAKTAGARVALVMAVGSLAMEEAEAKAAVVVTAVVNMAARAARAAASVVVRGAEVEMRAGVGTGVGETDALRAEPRASRAPREGSLSTSAR
jgi:hypothetical protein